MSLLLFHFCTKCWIKRKYAPFSPHKQTGHFLWSPVLQNRAYHFHFICHHPEEVGGLYVACKNIGVFFLIFSYLCLCNFVLQLKKFSSFLVVRNTSIASCEARRMEKQYVFISLSLKFRKQLSYAAPREEIFLSKLNTHDNWMGEGNGGIIKRYQIKLMMMECKKRKIVSWGKNI